MTDQAKAMELLPCPFCRGTNIGMRGTKELRWIACSCGLESPSDINANRAIDYWNTRSLIASKNLGVDTDMAMSQIADVRKISDTILSAISQAKEGAGGRPASFLAWAVEMFGPVAELRGERLMRFAEEAIELAHADGMERATFDAIANRVYARERGNVNKEIGQAQACLETYAENIGESASSLAEIEWQRVQKIPRAEWNKRHAAKQSIGIALPNSDAASAVPPQQERLPAAMIPKLRIAAELHVASGWVPIVPDGNDKAAYLSDVVIWIAPKSGSQELARSLVAALNDGNQGARR